MKKKGGWKKHCSREDRIPHSALHLHPLNRLKKKNLPRQPFVDETLHEYEYSHVRNELLTSGEKETISITITVRLSVRFYYGDS